MCVLVHAHGCVHYMQVLVSFPFQPGFVKLIHGAVVLLFPTRTERGGQAQATAALAPLCPSFLGHSEG